MGVTLGTGVTLEHYMSTCTHINQSAKISQHLNQLLIKRINQDAEWDIDQYSIEGINQGSTLNKGCLKYT